MICRRKNFTLTSFRPSEVRWNSAIFKIFDKNPSLKLARISFRPSSKLLLNGLNELQNHSLPYLEQRSSQGRFSIFLLVLPKMLPKLLRYYDFLKNWQFFAFLSDSSIWIDYVGLGQANGVLRYKIFFKMII